LSYCLILSDTIAAMSALERGRLTICFHYGSGGGAGNTEKAAHQADHRKIAKEWHRRLKGMDEEEKKTGNSPYQT